MDFLKKVEGIKHYRQSVMCSDNVNLLKSVKETFQEFKIMIMTAVYEKIQIFGMGDYMEN